MNISLKDKVVLVTGASQGIGAAIAIALGKSGATVAIQYNRNEKEQNQLRSKLVKVLLFFKLIFLIPNPLSNYMNRYF